jgi:hypothetical protein
MFDRFQELLKGSPFRPFEVALSGGLGFLVLDPSNVHIDRGTNEFARILVGGIAFFPSEITAVDLI